MNATHAKPANPFVAYGNGTHDLGLKKPCGCGSEKKFKACCYSTPQKGWGWVALFAKNMQLVPTFANELPGVDESFKDVPFVLVISTYEEGVKWLAENGVSKASPIYLVRLAMDDLLTHIENQFEKGQRVIVVVPPEVSGEAEGAMHDLTV